MLYYLLRYSVWDKLVFVDFCLDCLEISGPPIKSMFRLLPLMLRFEARRVLSVAKSQDSCSGVIGVVLGSEEYRVGSEDVCRL